jgi:hypothetical protein
LPLSSSNTEFHTIPPEQIFSYSNKFSRVWLWHA